MRNSLAQRILAFHFLVLALPLYIATCLFFERFYERAISGAYVHLKGVVEEERFVLEGFEPFSEMALQDIVFFLSEDPKVLEQQLSALRAADPRVTFLALTLPKQVGGPYPLLDQGEASYTSGGEIEAILEKGHGAFMRFLDLPEPTLVFGTGRVLSHHQRPEGVLLAFKQGASFATGKGALALLNSAGVVVKATDEQLMGQTFAPLSSSNRRQLIASGALGGIVPASIPLAEENQLGDFDFLFHGKTYLAYRAAFPSFSLVAYLPKHLFFIQAMQQFMWIYVTYGVVLLIGILLSYLLSKWLSRPLRELGHVMGSAYEGNLDARFEQQPFGFEFNALGSLFNHTIETLVSRMRGAEDERIKKEGYSKEVEVGREMQHRLCSMQLPNNARIASAARYLQAQDVGGDFYCIENMNDGRILIAIGDASGKGISSCLYALTARSLLRTYAKLEKDLGGILKCTNNAFVAQTEETGMFVALLTGILDPASGVLTYYSCGHTPGFVKRRDGGLVMLEHAGMALGLVEMEEARPDALLLHPGDIIVFLTKGLLEATNEKHQLFSQGRVQELLQQRKWSTAQEVVDGLYEEYQAFTEGSVQNEEAVFIAVKLET